MLRIPFKKQHVLGFGLVACASVALTGCSSLNQQPYDVDGVYYSEKIKVEDTHEKGAYYTDYFKETTENSDAYFTDIDGYTSGYKNQNGGWGDATTDTTVVYDYGLGGWGYPYWGWNGWNFGWAMGYGYGYGFGWGGYWGYPYYGWGNPYWGWNYPYYNHRNISRNHSVRTLTSRQMVSLNKARGINSQTFGNTRVYKFSTTFARETSKANRMNLSNSRFENNSFNRSSRSNRIESNRTQPVNRPTYTPSSNSRMQSGGSFGGSRMGGGMRTGGGRR